MVDFDDDCGHVGMGGCGSSFSEDNTDDSNLNQVTNNQKDDKSVDSCCKATTYFRDALDQFITKCPICGKCIS